MTAGTALSIVLIVLGVSACWLVVLWQATLATQKTLRLLMEQNYELARLTWAMNAAGQPEQAQVAAGLTQAVRQVNGNPFSQHQAPITDDELLDRI